MTIGVLHERGMSNRAIARQLGVHEKAVRYRLGRLASGARDRRADRVSSVEPWAETIAYWMAAREGRGVNGLVLFEVAGGRVSVSTLRDGSRRGSEQVG